MRRRVLVLCIVLVASIVVYFSLQNNAISVTLSQEHAQLGASGIDGVSGRLLVSPYGVQDAVIDTLSQTQYTLWMWQYDITATNIIALMQNLATLGTDIKVILENDMYQGGAKSRNSFTEAVSSTSIAVKSDEHLGSVYNHTKTMITDDHVIISTANLGFQGFWNNREYRFISDDPDVVEYMKELFMVDRMGEEIDQETLPQEIVVCPVNCRQVLDLLLGSAEHSILVHGQYLEDPTMIDQLDTLEQEGVRVQLLLGRYQDVDSVDHLKNVRIQYAPYLHVKAMLIDNSVLFITSMNFSTNAIENNREIGMLITDQTAIETFVGQFFQDWNSATIITDSGPESGSDSGSDSLP